MTLAVYGRALPAVCATMDKARAHLVERGVDLQGVVDHSLAPDMKPLHFQVRSVVHHSLGAVEGLRSGRFAPPTPSPPYEWDELRGRVATAAATLAAIPDAEIEDLATGEVLFEAGERRRLFTAPEFVLSFSLPNLFFHAATTYDILRLLGVPLEKRDYLGQVPGRWV